MSRQREYPPLSYESLRANVPLVDVPFSNVREVPKGSIYTESVQAFPMDRLLKIKQLSFAAFEGRASGRIYAFERPSYTRFVHSFEVAVLMDKVLSQNGFDHHEREVGAIAAMTHDLATPALGDATKKVAPERLDEEAFWGDVIGEKGEALLRKHAIPKELVAAIIRNEGVLGKVLDVTDRIAYVMNDTPVKDGQVQEHIDGDRPIDLDLKDLAKILHIHPNLGNIYQDINVDRKQDEVYFSDPDRLQTFLHLRALLHQRYYMNPHTIGRDVLVANLVAPLLASDPTAQPDNLRRMWDVQLLAKLDEQFEPGNPAREQAYKYLIQWIPEVQRFESKEALQKGRDALAETSGVVIVGEKEVKGFKTATDTYKVKEADGKLVSLKEYDPEGAAEIDVIEEATRGHFLFFSKIEQEHPTIQRLIQPQPQAA